MGSRASTAATAQFLASLLAARATPLTELADTIAAVTGTVSRLLDGTMPSRSEVVETVAAPPRRGRPPKAALPAPVLPEPQPVEIQEVEFQETENEIVAEAAEPAPVRRRGRPPHVRIETPATLEAEVEVAAAPRLLRRAEVAPAAPADPIEQDRPNGQDVHARGVVKWFDSRSNKGVLRLTGMAGDIALDAELLAASRVRRLYKDQEVDVVGEYLEGHFHPKTLSIPGQVQDPLLTGGQRLTAPSRQARPVLVEVKRPHSRFQSARAEAEHALGRIGAKSTP